ncbi:hypothetical protein [Parvularcula lutaonensis]|uniref:Uncharacterized protein n=1 Tax=Parvularcula lutaonensis TaxID=491923 RepID=A0ABV7MAJ6_9PROT|nr:hypothetical protein [Parvularcula lutaonensis]GGY38178.1 hypothetical protein GCM10007148_03080 [Parvularcula lutaonensis]
MEGLSEWFFGLSEAYNVNPWIFGILYVGGIPVFLGILAWLTNRARQKKSVTLQALLLLYFAIQPYLYVAVFGENLPGWVYGAIAVLIALGLWSTYNSVQKKKREALEEAGDTDQSSELSMASMSSSEKPK